MAERIGKENKWCCLVREQQAYLCLKYRLKSRRRSDDGGKQDMMVHTVYGKEVIEEVSQGKLVME